MATPAQPPKLRLAIVGGGVAGLCLAGTIVQYASVDAFDIDVYEAADEITDVGAGVTIYGRSYQIINALADELVAELGRIGRTSPALDFYHLRMDGGPGSGEEVVRTPLGPGCSYHRAGLRRAFLTQSLASAPNVKVHFSKRLESYTHDNKKAELPITMHFRDGTTAQADVLLGCDGVRSPVRGSMLDIAATELKRPELRDLIPAWYSGWCTHRSLIPIERLDEEWAKLAGEDAGPHRLHDYHCLYSGKRAHIVAYAIENKTLVNIGVFVYDPEGMGKPFPDERWVRDVDPGVLLKILDGWEPEIIAMAKPVTQTSRWAVHVVGPLPTYIHGPVALIGDAAHALTPHGGTGANQALEDAYLMGRLLSSPLVSRETLPQVLKAYDSIRRPAGNAAQAASFVVGKFCSLMTPDRDDDDLEAVANAYKSYNRWYLKGMVEDDVQKALRVLKAYVDGKDPEIPPPPPMTPGEVHPATIAIGTKASATVSAEA